MRDRHGGVKRRLYGVVVWTVSTKVASFCCYSWCRSSVLYHLPLLDDSPASFLLLLHIAKWTGKASRCSNRPRATPGQSCSSFWKMAGGGPRVRVLFLTPIRKSRAKKRQVLLSRLQAFHSGFSKRFPPLKACVFNWENWVAYNLIEYTFQFERLRRLYDTEQRIEYHHIWLLPDDDKDTCPRPLRPTWLYSPHLCPFADWVIAEDSSYWTRSHNATLRLRR